MSILTHVPTDSEAALKARIRSLEARVSLLEAEKHGLTQLYAAERDARALAERKVKRHEVTGVLPAGTIAWWSYAYPGGDQDPCIVLSARPDYGYTVRYFPFGGNDGRWVDAHAVDQLEAIPQSYIKEHLQYLVKERDRVGLPDQNNGEKGTNDER
ncbi:hypothetical protein [Xanthobacter sp. ZOL 2024]